MLIISADFKCKANRDCTASTRNIAWPRRRLRTLQFVIDPRPVTPCLRVMYNRLCQVGINRNPASYNQSPSKLIASSGARRNVMSSPEGLTLIYWLKRQQSPSDSSDHGVTISEKWHAIGSLKPSCLPQNIISAVRVDKNSPVPSRFVWLLKLIRSESPPNFSHRYVSHRAQLSGCYITTLPRRLIGAMKSHRRTRLHRSSRTNAALETCVVPAECELGIYSYPLTIFPSMNDTL